MARTVMTDDQQVDPGARLGLQQLELGMHPRITRQQRGELWRGPLEHQRPLVVIVAATTRGVQHVESRAIPAAAGAALQRPDGDGSLRRCRQQRAEAR